MLSVALFRGQKRSRLCVLFVYPPQKNQCFIQNESVLHRSETSKLLAAETDGFKRGRERAGRGNSARKAAIQRAREEGKKEQPEESSPGVFGSFLCGFLLPQGEPEEEVAAARGGSQLPAHKIQWKSGGYLDPDGGGGCADASGSDDCGSGVFGSIHLK
jgi:hypothetical protein